MTRNKRIFDCFIFYRELDLLELRLRQSYDKVDYFVICESTVTFTGQPKDLVFQCNRDRFKPFLDKIIPVSVADAPAAGSAWDREHHQRNCIRRGLADLAEDDIVIVSDCDEIVSPAAIDYLRENRGYFVLDMPMYQFFMNMCALKSGWRKVFAYSGALHERIPDYNTPRENPMRARSRFEGTDHLIERAGWHFTFLGGPDAVRDKLGAYSHTEAWQQNMRQGRNAERQMEVLKDVGGGRFLEFCEIDSTFPGEVRSRLDHYTEIGFIKTAASRIKELERLYFSSDNAIIELRCQLRYRIAILKYLHSRYAHDTIDLALGKPATQSSLSPWSRGRTIAEDAGRCVNGMILNNFGCHTDKEDCPWWEVDLEAPYLLSTVCIYNRPGHLAGRLRRFSLLGSADRSSWNKLYEKTDDAVAGIEIMEGITIPLASTQPVRYLRIRLDAQDYLHFDECLVFGQPA